VILTCMYANQNRTEGLNPYWEVLDLRGDLLIVKTYLQADEDSAAIYAVVEEYKGRYYVEGVGVTYHDALRDAQRRAYELNDKKTLENLEMFYRSF
jgi:hypothetical protein